MLIAQKAYDYIVRQEVSSPAYYERHYRHPEWPGGASGITVACGYDLGYASPAKINADWSSRVSPAMLAAMVRCSGVKGLEAKALLPAVRNLIDIPWADAEKVFQERDIPQWTAAVQRALPNCDKISSLCLGVHVATAYNRGVGGYSSNAPRFTEMHRIRDYMASTDFKPIGNEFLSMRRLWPTMKGLQDRYTEASKLWDEGLTLPVEVPLQHPPVPHDGEDPLNAGPARTKPPATTKTQHTVTGGVVAGTIVVANQAANSGTSTHVIIAVVVAGLVLAGLIWYAWYRDRNP